MTIFQLNHPALEIEETELLKVNKVFNHALDRFERTIRQGTATLTDENGPKGGLDKRCKLLLSLYPRGLAFASGRGTSFSEAANDACEKVTQMINKKLGKRRSEPRKDWQSYNEIQYS